jgi:hypothetical protein
MSAATSSLPCSVSAVGGQFVGLSISVQVAVVRLPDLGMYMDPKASSEEMLAGCVVRKKFAAIWQDIEVACSKRKVPGWYLADAPGCGKSTALYWCVNEARAKGWICPYVVS